ncbi:MAG: N-acetyltransferase [Lachnospiraceae bacterium]|nr:N-acetyltransferase [Lachnospiraceae bacterium]
MESHAFFDINDFEKIMISFFCVFSFRKTMEMLCRQGRYPWFFVMLKSQKGSVAEVVKPLQLLKKEKIKMERIIKTVTGKFTQETLDFVEKVFTEYSDEEEGKVVRELVAEIRSKKYYIPELDLMMVNEIEEVIGYVMFSGFHLEGNYEKELLLLSPAAVKTELQRQHISKELIEYGFEVAKKLGYKAVIVEGNPQNYQARGFRTSANYGIVPGETVHLPDIACLMVKELEPGALEHIKGQVNYDFYESLR